MNNNYWNQQQNDNKLPQQNGNPRAGHVTHDHRHHQQQQHSPTLKPPPQSPPPYSPMPSQQQGRPSQQAWPASQSWPSNGQQGQEQGRVANTMQKVRQWSGRVAAVPPVDQNPLVRHRPPALLEPLKRKPWKRSRTMRISMQMKHRRVRWKQGRPKIQAIASSILIALLLLVLISTSSSTAYAFKFYHDQLPHLQDLAKQQISQTTRIYDRNGVLLYEAYDNKHASGGRRTPVSYIYLPQVLKDAQTSAEDPTFWTNSGIDPQGILRAAIQFVQAGSVQSGGSTITQQLIKNLTNDTAQTLSRKIPEAALAIGLTQQYSKEKILEMYFNVSSYGAQDLGVESAVEEYFHLNPQCDSSFKCIPGVYYLNCNAAHIKECNPDRCDQSKYCNPLLGLARASLLAGIPQSPSAYDPTLGMVDQAAGQKYYLERQQYVLDQMVKLGVEVPGLGIMTQKMADDAIAMTTKMKFPAYSHVYYHGCEHFVNWVIKQLSQQLGEQTFLTGGFNIRTTIDYKLEAYVESAVRRHIQQPEYQKLTGGYGPLNSPAYNVNDGAVVVMNAKTGEVLAMNGSTDWNDKSLKVKGEVNAALAYRSPGSSFKLVVYTTAFEQGWYPGIVLPDVKTYFPGYPTPPTDYGGSYNNKQSSIQFALANSFNIPAIKAFEYAGIDNVANMARRLGITALDEDVANYNAANGTHLTVGQHYGPAMALGSVEVPLIQMTGAYQVFANQGRRIPPQSVLDIWDNYGHHLYHYDPTHPEEIQVVSPQIAYLMTSILKDEKSRSYEFESDHDLSMWDWQDADGKTHEVAAKTGTTQDFKDNLTLGYTPDVVVGVWTGNANNEAFGSSVIGITGAAPIWHDVIEHVSGRCDSGINPPCFHYPFTQSVFTQPDGLIKQCVSTVDGLAGGGNCDTYMLDGEQPQQYGVSSGVGKPKA